VRSKKSASKKAIKTKSVDQNLTNFREQILAATANNTAICLQGGGSKSWYGNALQGELLDTRPYSGIIAHEPTELVLTARCGTPLSEIETALEQHGQMLAFEPPHFGTSATIGGMLAAGLSGPRRAQVGAVRDYVLGVTMMNGRGECLQFGGQVMKNVAGYDVSRLMAGSMGSLGLLLDISLKLSPKPIAETTLAFSMSEVDAITSLNRWAGLALPISASSYHVGRLMLRLSGSEAALRLAKQSLGGQEVENASMFWQSLREQTHHFFEADGEHGLWRISLPSTTPALKLKGKCLIEWGGAQRWLWSNETPELLRSTVQQAGGHLTLFRYGDKKIGVFTELSKPLQHIHRQLKQGFDPAGIFNRDRLY
jgi:glycolate oxidase FAD binding subunit